MPWISRRTLINSFSPLQFPSHTLPIQHHNHQTHNYQSTSRQHHNDQRQRVETEDASLLLHYVTERILASVLPARRRESLAHNQHCPDVNGGGTTISAVDDHEKELIVMLEQKHGKVRNFEQHVVVSMRRSVSQNVVPSTNCNLAILIFCVAWTQ